MIIEESTVKYAFRAYVRSYAEDRSWSINDRAGGWREGRNAFEGVKNAIAFNALFDRMVSWQVFRPLSIEARELRREPAWEAMRKVDKQSAFRSLRLSELRL